MGEPSVLAEGSRIPERLQWIWSLWWLIATPRGSTLMGSVGAFSVQDAVLVAERVYHCTEPEEIFYLLTCLRALGRVWLLFDPDKPETDPYPPEEPSED